MAVVVEIVGIGLVARERWVLLTTSDIHWLCFINAIPLPDILRDHTDFPLPCVNHLAAEYYKSINPR